MSARFIKIHQFIQQKKINGERAYILARKGIKFKLKQIKKKIYGLKILNHDINNKKTSFLVTCSSGTYVRSLANDLALSLNSFCYCTKITRLRDGIFSKKFISFKKPHKC